MFRKYKNYINHFRRTNKIESLRTFFNYNKKYNLDWLNAGYESNYVDSFSKNSTNYNSIKYNVIISELLPLVREIIINWGDVDIKPLKDYNNFSNSINKWRSFNDELSGLQAINKSNEDDILRMMWILWHEQFHLQKLNNNIFDFINSFYWIYSDKELNIHIKAKFDIDILEIYSVSIWIFIILNNQNNVFIDLNHEDTYKTFTKEAIINFINNFTISLDKITSHLEKNKTYMFNESDFKQYWIKDLLEFPIYEVDWRFISPIHQLIINRVTNFLYFDIIEWNRLWNEFWDANERYIYSVLENINPIKYNLINIDDEYEKIKGNKIAKNKIVDYVIYDNNSILLFECKTNCLSLESKQEWINDKDKKRIVEALYQLYFWINTILNTKTYIWIKNINITNCDILPVLSYIFPPFINFWKVRIEIIDMLNKMLDEEWIDTKLTDKYPFIIIDNTLYNHLIHLINTIWLDVFIKEIIKKDPNHFETDPLIFSLYKDYNVVSKIAFYDTMSTIDEVITSKLAK